MPSVDTAPAFSNERAREICAALYGLEAEAEPLPSERDQNFLMIGADRSKRVLKIANPDESRAVLELQNRVMSHLCRQGDGLSPRVVPGKSGDEIHSVRDERGRENLVRLITYLEGVPLAESRPQSRELLHSLGEFFGTLVTAMRSLHQGDPQPGFLWEMRRGPDTVRKLSSRIEDPARRGLLENFLSWFESYTAPCLPHLEVGLIHNDGNDYNIIIGPPSQREENFGSRAVAGVIDFGDMVRSYILADLAVVCAYAMLDKEDPLAAATEIVRGYHAVRPLKEVELGALYGLICLRLMLSVSIADHQKKLNPDNEYLSISENHIWTLLERLHSVHPQLAQAVFRQACGLPASSRAEKVRRWLKKKSASFHSPVGFDLGCEQVEVFDLSVGSSFIVHPDLLSDANAFTERIFDRIESRGARLGIGRYNEARLAYSTPQFREHDNELAESRTVHLGIDIFLPPGSEVYAPLEGTVHSFQVNDLPLDYGPTIILEHRSDEGESFFTLYGHLSKSSLSKVSRGQRIKKGECFAAIGGVNENGGWPPHLHFQIMTHLLGWQGNFPGVARASQRRIWLCLCPDPNLMLGLPEESLEDNSLSGEEILHRRKERLGPSLSISYHKHLTIVRGSGIYLYDRNGRKYLDGVNNVPHVGHSHPKVVAAAAKQLAVLNTNTRYLHENLVRYAERLCSTMPPPLEVCYIVNSGSEANDLALRLARNYSGRRDVIAVEGAYHGHLTSLIEISSYKFNGPGGQGRPSHVQLVSMPDRYRGPYRYGDRKAGKEYAADVDRAIAAIRDEGREPAVFISESFLGCGGQIELPPSYLKEVYRRIRKAGGLCIADEVQVGFGRVGSHFWGFQTQGVLPDIVTLGKPIGDGFPLAAVVTRREIAERFNNGMEYFNTYGGNPVSCAVGLAVLEVIEEEELQKKARLVGNHLLGRLRDLQKRFPLLGDVRGRGLFIGVELVVDPESRIPAPLQAAYITERLREEGVLISTDGPDHNVLKIKPPLVFSGDNADLLADLLERVLGEDAVRI